MPMKSLQGQGAGRELGRIRLGEKNDQNNPTRRQTFRLTSFYKDLLMEASKHYGGTVREWSNAPTEARQWELDTEVDSLAVWVPKQDIDAQQNRELWSKGGIQRRCDEEVEEMSGEPCLCQAEGEWKCVPTTHLDLLLPDIPDMGTWHLTTGSFYAAKELRMAVRTLSMIAGKGGVPEAALTMETRTKKKDNQTRHFVVPVLRVTHSPRELLGGQQAFSAIEDAPQEPTDSVPGSQPGPVQGDSPERQLSSSGKDTQASGDYQPNMVKSLLRGIKVPESAACDWLSEQLGESITELAEAPQERLNELAAQIQKDESSVKAALEPYIPADTG